MRLRLSCTRSCHTTVRFLGAAEPVVDPFSVRFEVAADRGRRGGGWMRGRGCKRGRFVTLRQPWQPRRALPRRWQEREKNNAPAVLLRSYCDTALNLESQSLLAGEEVVEDSHVLDERPKLLLLRGVVLKTIEAGMTRCESGAAKQGSQCCNEPNQR